MGFADPDKRNSDHDLMCEFLCQPDVMKKIYQAFGFYGTPGVASLEVPISKGTGQYRTTIGFLDVVYQGGQYVRGYGTSVEYDDQGRAKNAVDGAYLVDLYEAWGRFETHVVEVLNESCPQYAVRSEGTLWCSWADFPRGTAENAPSAMKRQYENARQTALDALGEDGPKGSKPSVGDNPILHIEVKTNISSLGDVMRQINLYREYERRKCVWLLAVSSSVRLRAAEVKLLRQSNISLFVLESFDKWKAEALSSTVDNTKSTAVQV